MEFSEDFIKENNLTEEQVKAVSEFGKGHIAELQQQWDGKANENANNILDGVITSTQKQFGISLERQQGEKHADYLKRLSDQVVSSKQEELEKLKGDYEQKLKEFKGGDALKSELDKAKADLDEALQKYADYDELKEKATKADEYGQQLSGLKLEVAFNGAKPNFPDSVNPYEAKAKWEEFKSAILNEYNIEIVDGEAVAISKENQYKQSKLSDLVAKDENIQELSKGRQQGGTGARPAEGEVIEGIPFKVPKDADAKTRSKLIKEHLAEKGIGPAHTEYSKQFAEMNKKIMAGNKAA